MDSFADLRQGRRKVSDKLQDLQALSPMFLDLGDGVLLQCVMRASIARFRVR